jgi:cation transport regulator ChaC
LKIACLGWGSLIWRPESLLIHRKWFSDGPFIPIEYSRKSSDGRLTLVINKTAKPIRVLWSLMATENLEEAIESLRTREGIPKSKSSLSIASINAKDLLEDETDLTIQNWAKSLNLDAVVWTNLPSKFNNVDGTSPTLKEAIEYINQLDINTRLNVEEYIRRTPKQIDTAFRRKFESEFGWTIIE